MVATMLQIRTRTTQVCSTTLHLQMDDSLLFSQHCSTPPVSAICECVVHWRVAGAANDSDDASDQDENNPGVQHHSPFANGLLINIFTTYNEVTRSVTCR